MIMLDPSLAFAIIRWIVLLGEGYLAKRIYRILTLTYEYQQRLILLRFLSRSGVSSSEPLRSTQTQTTHTLAAASQGIPASQVISGQFPSYSKIAWSRLAFGVCLGSMFLSVFLVTLYVLRPITFQWVLFILPMLLPLILLPLPYLFHPRPPVALFLLGLAIGIGLLLLLVTGI